MAKYHISGNGEPAICDAKVKCRLGGESGKENHFDTPDEARQAFEKQQAEKSVPKVRKKKTDAELASTGTEKQIQALAKKKNLPLEVVIAAHDRVKDEDTKAQLELNKDFPVEKMTNAGFKLLEKKSPMQFHRRASDASVSYDQIKDSPNIVSLKNSENNLSAQDLVKITTAHPEFKVDTAIYNEKYPLKDTVSSFSDDELGRIASTTTNPINARVAAKAVVDNGFNVSETTLSRIAANKYVSPTVLHEIAEKKENFYSDVAIANNSSADRETKELVAKRNETAASLLKLEDLQRENPQAVYEVTKSMESSYDGGKRTVKFNKNAVEQAGLNPSDIDAIVRFKNGDWLHNASYDPKTATYTGYID